jgi:hypothetical protein
MQTDTDILRGAGHTPAPATGGLMVPLKAQRQEAGADTGDTRLALFAPVKGCGLILEIDREGAVVPCRSGVCLQVSPPRSGGRDS